MREMRKIASISCLLMVTGCAKLEPGSVVDQPATYSYTNPEDSGLKAGLPFPGPGDVCVSLRKNSMTKPFETESHFLIACPKHETGAIGDRISQQQAAVVGNAKHWVVLSVPINSIGSKSNFEIKPATNKSLQAKRDSSLLTLPHRSVADKFA